MKAEKNKNGIIDGALECKEEEKKLVGENNLKSEAKILELPLFPNLGE